jgi:hypothetical protein
MKFLYLLKKFQNAQVSDTTEVDSSNTARQKKIFHLLAAKLPASNPTIIPMIKPISIFFITNPMATPNTTKNPIPTFLLPLCSFSVMLFIFWQRN